MRANRLITNQSYLLQHARNPVDWQPWTSGHRPARAMTADPALNRYSTAIVHVSARVLRGSGDRRVDEQHFVCIKVDREERPDIDDVYRPPRLR